ncbi:MAG: J domain-containing protein [Acidobacteria bacterium]|nr:J domain-containing protein [Acidobacteriota bacterium]
MGDRATPKGPDYGSNPHAILGVGPDAQEREIRLAYFARVKEHPPERDPAGFRRVREAYEKLRTSKARALQYLDQFEQEEARAVQPPELLPVPLTRLLVLLAERRRCEILRTNYSGEEEWPG